MDFLYLYSAIWKDGPLYKNNKKDAPLYKKNEVDAYIRDSNKKVALKLLHNSQNSVEFIINEAKKFSIKNDQFIVLYGISQKPDTNDYILVQNNFINLTNWTNKIEKIGDLIQEKQLKINDHSDVIFEWIPYKQLDQIKEVGKNGFVTTYSAIWKNGPLYYHYDKYKRESNKEVALKLLHNSQNLIDFVVNEARKYLTQNDAFLVLYGISQNPDTNDYILVQNNSINLINWASGNEKIGNFIQKRQFDTKYHDDVVLEWIPYSQFDQIKEIGKNGLMTVYSAIWMDGPLHKKYLTGKVYTRDPNKKVALKVLHNSQNPIEFVINESEKYSKKNDAFLVLFGISQNPDTNDYILVLNWISGNVKIYNFIQEMQLKIEDNDAVFEWISYKQFNKIKIVDKGRFVTLCLAIWKFEVTLLCFNDPQKLLDKVKESNNSFKIYGVSQNPNKQDFILVLQKEFCTEYGKKYCQNCSVKYIHIDNKWCKQCIITAKFFKSNNKKIDDLVKEMRLKINSCFNIVFEWIPYNQFNYISKEIGKGGFATVYSAIWKDGPLKYDIDTNMYIRIPNKKIALKSLDDSQNLTDKFLNEVKEYSINRADNILNVYGISQNPVTKDYIIVLEFADGGSFNNWINKNYKDFDWKNKIHTLLSIIEGLKRIHQRQKIHHDFHAGNILFSTKNLNILNRKSLFISDMGLCDEVSDTTEMEICGVMPYMAPEVLRGKPYTQAADIYSFSMIMYFTATGNQPFISRAHDHSLALDICNGIRPEINELEAPKCFIDLMKRCWDSNPNNRPDATEIHSKIKSFQDFYNSYKKSDTDATEIKNQFKEAENYRKSHSSFLKIEQHPQAIYTSQLLSSYTKELVVYDNTECLGCEVINVFTDQS
ncbi:kinase-like domain-containing protein [Rhizophagus clarus]|uniref:Kinase-like domain-containing protein n=1 Tax=Rhizophagus clarus TaxID=94130 RepID=A0A8H3QL88_9GLOM|nr:kinase-like domain-containing protein [Rhizophagus clarus]